MTRPHVWVVEMMVQGKWLPCAQASLGWLDAMYIVNLWRVNNPDDQFRVAKYVRVEPKKKLRKPRHSTHTITLKPSPAGVVEQDYEVVHTWPKLKRSRKP